MPKGSSTIIIAREDLSIPGAEPEGHGHGAANAGARLFELLESHRPDAVVLDLSDTKGAGIEAISRIRESSTVPLLVVHDPADRRATDYRLAGAVECLATPVDIVCLNRMIQDIIRVTGEVVPVPKPIQARSGRILSFSTITFQPDRNLLLGDSGERIRLTTLENDALLLLTLRAHVTCSRAELCRVLYGPQRPSSDRAIDVVINRLRKKLAMVSGAPSDLLVKTEFRRGYLFVADVFEGAHHDRQRSTTRHVA